ncbi:PAS domain S-box-containing protein/diguanylate cyclase (GGDEF) domain-containing protein [Marinobacterium stanieri]|uniref:PAS domain S-box-containing protein/diguanylate cyclase (GGDEF) domain-containing protein n=2 Tax=Marinobacterium stanieri TaxID=49186 RepID=A0A1N6Q002_9GAMM|nr:PAS domain S-box-containing protein/diguanylate cyclase (GGDEF) domain-containing protein [Marinobacterium stanieri]
MAVRRWFWIPFGGVLLSVILVALFMLFAYLGEQRMQDSIRKQAEVLAHSLESTLVRSIQDVHGRMRILARHLAASDLGLEADSELVRQVRNLVQAAPQLRELVLLDSQGDLLATSGDADLRQSQVLQLKSCLEWYQPGQFLAVGTPVPGRSISHPVSPEGVTHLPVCMPVHSEGREEPLWVVAILNPDALREQFFPVVHSLKAEAALYRYDGQALVSFPKPDVSEAQGGGGSARYLSLLAERDWGVLQEVKGETTWITGYRSTSMYPLLLTVSIDQDVALARWNKTISGFRWAVMLAVAVILVAVLIMSWLNRRQWRLMGELKLLSAAISTTANAVLITDRQGRIQWVNGAFTEMMGYEPQEVLGRKPSLLNSGEHSKLFFNRLWHAILDGQVWRGEVVNINRNRQRLVVEQTITPILDDKGQVSHFVAVQEDVTLRKQAEDRSKFLSTHDPLTGLPNRRALMHKLQVVLEALDSIEVVLLYIDLDNFKSVNDTLGHGKGDQLLQIAVQRLQQALPESVFLSRLGGDEFAVVMAEPNARAQVEMMAERICSVLADSFELKNARFQLTASIGIAVAGSQTDPQTLLRQADLAMYSAKQIGRGGFQVFSPDMDNRAQRRVALEQGLRKVVESGCAGLEMRYQPIFDAQRLVPVGAEVLLRWQDGDDWVSPAEFIPVAEDSGMIVDIGAWQLGQVLQQLSEWDQQGHTQFYLSLNISAVQLARDGVAQRLLDMLELHALDRSRVVVEITETTLMGVTRQVEDNLTRLESSGVRLSIDDFGTGYSSLGYLRELDASYLKIDRSFVIGIGNRDSDEEIVLAMLALAKSLNMKVVAEGVDTNEQLQFLRQHGCDLIQGFLLSRPVTAAEIPPLLVGE